MNMFTAIKSVLKNHAKFSGRASRSEYWWWILAQLLFFFILAILIQSIAPELLLWVSTVFMLLLFVPNLAVQYRRLQDCNIHGAWCLICYIPYLYFSISRIVWQVLMSQGDFSLIAAYYEYAVSASIVILQSVSGACGIFLLVKSCTRGTDGDNKYGPDPLA